METMKYPNVSGGTSMAVSGNGANHVDEVDSIFSSSCWQHSGNSGNLQPEFIEAHKLMLENASGGGGGPLGASDKLLMGSPISQQGDDSELATKATMDALDNLLLNSQPMNTSLAELKPLPPFAGYTANLSINGIQGQHYQLLAQRIPEENNNTYGNYGDQNIVSSSTCNVSVDSAGDSNKGMYEGVTKLGYVNCANPDSVSSAKIFDECGGNASATDAVAHIKTEMSEYDISSIEDIAAIIGSAIADTTVPNNNNNPDPEENAGSRDSWMDLDAWIDGACVEQHKNLIITQEALSEFVIPTTNSDYIKPQQLQQQQPVQGSSTLQTLLTHGYMPLLQNRLQNGPPIKQETPSSTNYSNDIISTSSPPANVGSTTDNLLLTVSGRYIPSYSLHGINDDPRIRSPDLVGQSYPHPTTTTPAMPKKSRSRAHKKQQQQSANSTVFQSDQSLGLLGKEKPVHRCNICNRGFLNKSNIKVHLRTHTGEKPFRCDTCAKAFRQKAHLLKHQQIHKRVGRD